MANSLYSNPDWQKAYKGFFESPSGTSTVIGNTKVTMGEGGKALLSTIGNPNPRTGQEQVMEATKDTDPSLIAQWDPGILAAWENKYGKGTTPTTVNQPTGGDTTSYAPPAAPTSISSGLLYTAPSYTPTEAETVEGRMKGLLADNSKYLELARAGGINTAANRGLLNSYIAAAAGEKAAIESALPIATSDAGYLQNRGLQGQQGEIQSYLAGQGHVYDIDTVRAQEQASSRLSAQEAEQDRILEKLKNEGLSSLSAQEAEQVRGLEEYKAANELNLETIRQDRADSRLATESRVKRLLAEMDISSAEKKTFTDLVVGYGQTFTTEMDTIHRDPNVSAESKTKAIQYAWDSYQANVTTAANILGYEIDWSDLFKPPVDEETPKPEDEETTPGGTEGGTS